MNKKAALAQSIWLFISLTYSVRFQQMPVHLRRFSHFPYTDVFAR